MLVVDAHEDLAWNMMTFQREYMRPVAETRRLEQGSIAVDKNGESCIGYPEWVAGNVAVVFATLFAAPARSALAALDAERCYRDSEEAHALYREQLELYHRWTRENPDHLMFIENREDLEAVLATWRDGSLMPRKVGLVVLMEGADGVRTPDELATWVAQGVRLVGPAWNRTQYTGGTGEPGGFTEAGKQLLAEMERQRIPLDLSHLAEEAVNEAFDLYNGTIIATHCNARALMPSARYPERHLSDNAIRGVAERGGVVGIVLANFFLRDGYTRDSARETVTIEHIVAHIDHMAHLVGDSLHIGIGSDFDGGFGLSRVPSGIESVADLPRIGEALSKQGYSDAAIEGMMGGNWLRLLRATLPAR